MNEYLRFIDSKDLREYNRNAFFSPAEWAVIIVNSCQTTAEEKARALLQLYGEDGRQLQDTSRISIGLCSCMRSKKIPFSEAVRENAEKIMEALQHKGKKWFRKPVYLASLRECCQEKGWKEEYIYESYAEAFAFLKKERREYLEDEELASVRICGMIRVTDMGDVEKQREKLVFYLNHDLEIYDIRFPSYILETDIGIDCYVHVPVSFHKGDLIRYTDRESESVYGVLPWEMPDRDVDKTLNRGGDGIDMVMILDCYIPDREVYRHGHSEIEKGYWDWSEHLNYLRFERCSVEELPEEQRKLMECRMEYLMDDDEIRKLQKKEMIEFAAGMRVLGKRSVLCCAESKDFGQGRTKQRENRVSCCFIHRRDFL